MHLIAYALLAVVAFVAGPTFGLTLAESMITPARAELSSDRPFEETVRAFETGQVLTGSKIINGVRAKSGEDPWQVALLVSWIADPAKARFCGGVIRSADWIQTAGHCVVNRQPNELHVNAGTIDLRVPGQRINVADVIVHPKYEVVEVPGVGKVSKYDTALLQLKTPLVMSDLVRPIEPVRLEQESQIAAPAVSEEEPNARATGFGVTETGAAALDLMSVELPIVSQKTCNSFASYDGYVTDDMVCAGYSAGGQDACNGDSGGPLTVFNPMDQKRKLYGLVSWGDECALPNKFGVFARVPLFNDWAEVCMSGSPDCKRF
jgi:secreted trypsin-like serine protease